MSSAGDIVEKYYQEFDAGRDGWQQLITDDVRFHSPMQHAHGREQFIALTAAFQRTVRETRLVRRFEDGDDVCSICESTVSTPGGASLTFTYAEWAVVRDGRVCAFQIYFDPRELARAHGRVEP